MAYTTMKKLITKYNKQYQSGAISAEVYLQYKEVNQNKLDVFYAGGRLTESQYEELSNMWIEVE